MKNYIKILLAAILITTAGFESCKKPDPEQLIYNIASSYVSHGKWKVSLFQENEKNETELFNGYVFQFSTNGTVTAVSGNATYNGTWSTATEGSKTKLFLNFTTAPLMDLNANWIIKNGSASSIQLQDMIGNSGETRELDFVKI